MPVSRPTDTIPHLRPYLFHGLDLSIGATHAIADCPFCSREGKLAVEVSTGMGHCWACGIGSERGGFNGLEFTRLVYKVASEASLRNRRAFLAKVSHDRRLLSPDTAAAWGVCSSTDGTWLVPGYSADGRLDQVYRRVRMQEKGERVWRLLPTPGIWPEGKAHALHLPIGDFDPQCPNVYICEGPWDGMALWEVAKGSSIAPCQILAVPGCNVWRDEWSEFCRGKCVTLLYDSDHPREYVPGRTLRAGYDGMVRVAKRLSGIAASVRWLRWGAEGYDSTRPSGWDVRDHLTRTGASGDDRVMPESGRKIMLDDLTTKIENAPHEWFTAIPSAINDYSHHTGSMEALPCSTWSACEEAWIEAMRWRTDMGDALAVILAVCASTQQAGNQLFLDLIGSPGSAKTTMCRGLLVSRHCVHLENVTKLISGFKKPKDGDKDCSFIARSNNKTWITCEFDTLGTSPQYHELMGKVRRIFDGETSATYGNSDIDRIYTAMRTPWIRAGTPKMMDHDQSQLGDRFIRYILVDPNEVEKREIAKRALQLEREAIIETANCTAGSITDPKTRRAHGVTGGYVDWLRENVEEQLKLIEVSSAAEDYCIDLAVLSADLRARPQQNGYKGKEVVESHDYKELPTRLARQNIRLASCLAVVLNRREVDADVLRIVRKVALDTAAGHSLNIAQWLCSPNPKLMDGRSYQECGGLANKTLEMWTGMSTERLLKYVTFLCKIDVLEWREARPSHGAWVLTKRVYDLYLRVTKDS